MGEWFEIEKKHQKKWGEYVSGEELGVLDGEMICNWKKHQKRWGERWRVRSWSLIYRLWTAEPITKNPFMKNPEILKTWFRELGFCPRLNTKILKSASQNTAEKFFFSIACWNIGEKLFGRQLKHWENWSPGKTWGASQIIVLWKLMIAISNNVLGGDRTKNFPSII